MQPKVVFVEGFMNSDPIRSWPHAGLLVILRLNDVSKWESQPFAQARAHLNMQLGHVPHLDCSNCFDANYTSQLQRI